MCRGLERAGRLRRYTGSEGKIVNDLDQAAPAAPNPLKASLGPVPGQELDRQATASAAQADGTMAWPGHPILATELARAGFHSLELRVSNLDVDLLSGRGCEWTTLGGVPDAPGLYAFTVEDEHQMRVAYVGRTEYPWMVTKGRLPQPGRRISSCHPRPQRHLPGRGRRRGPTHRPPMSNLQQWPVVNTGICAAKRTTGCRLGMLMTNGP